MSKTCETCKHRGKPINTEKNMYWCECGKTCVNGSGWEGTKPMNELKPEDVMRALEYCTTDNECDCDNCPYFYRYHCTNAVMQDALTLLREKDAEIERLTKERDNARRDCAVAEQNHYECKKELETARAEAITEFAELWKKWWYGQIQVAVNEYQESIIYNAIDQIAQELKGETDGKTDL